MADALGVDATQINSLGYTQNYIFYLTQDYDWWQGGFEVEGSMFGWRFGRWMTEEIPQMALLLDDEDPPLDQITPSEYYKETKSVEPEISENLGVVETQPPAVNAIFDTITFEWHGGHPGVDSFTVTLQQDDGGWVDCTRSNGSVYDEKGWEMKVSLDETPNYLGTLNRDQRDFLYIIQWETNWNDPTGTLRFKVEGSAKTAKGVEAYTVYSDSFELEPVDSVALSDLTVTEDSGDLIISVKAAYPANTSGWRLRSPYAGGSNPAIVSQGAATAIISVSGQADEECELVFDPDQQILTNTFSVTHTGQQHSITIDAESFSDGIGNTNGLGIGPVTITP
jgi:hypothetical protein